MENCKRKNIDIFRKINYYILTKFKTWNLERRWKNMTNEISTNIPAGLRKIFNTVRELDTDSQEQIFRSASIFAYGRVSGRKADYAEGYKAGYAKAMADAKAGHPA